MMNISFNALQFVKKLSKAGMPEAQAEVIAEQYSQLPNQNTDHLATKADLQDLRSDVKVLQSEFRYCQEQSEERLGKKIIELQLRMTMLMGGGFVVLSGMLLTTIKLVVKA